MSLRERQSPFRSAFVAFLIATVVGLSIGVLVFGDALEVAVVTAAGIGLGVGVAFYVFESAGRE